MSIYCSVVSVMRIVTKQLRLESRGFRYKVALYLSYLHIKFDDEIRREFLRIFQAQFLISLRPKLSDIYVRLYLQLLRLVTQIYGNERRCDKQNVDDGTLFCTRRSRLYFGAADQYICVQILFLLVIFSVLMSRPARGITSIIQKRLD